MNARGKADVYYSQFITNIKITVYKSALRAYAFLPSSMKILSTLKGLVLVAVLGCLVPASYLSAKDVRDSSRITLGADESAKNVRLSGKLSVKPVTLKGNRFNHITLTLERPISVKLVISEGPEQVVNGIGKIAVFSEIAPLKKRLISLAGKRVNLEGTFLHMLANHTEEVFHLDVTKILD